MENDQDVQNLRNRKAPIEMAPNDFFDAWDTSSSIESPISFPLCPAARNARGIYRGGSSSPGLGQQAPRSRNQSAGLAEEAASLVFDHSLFNSHPRFWGYVTSPAAPIGILGDLLASSAVNPNIGSWMLAPMATEIEAQSVRWIAELIGYPSNCEGLLVSGGNMANLLGFSPPGPIERIGTSVRWDSDTRMRRVSASTHPGKPTPGFRRRLICSARNRRDLLDTGRSSATDGHRSPPAAFRRIGRAGRHLRWLWVLPAQWAPERSILSQIAAICREHGAWFHVDGAYGALAAAAVPAQFEGLQEADSVAVDPHKWLYSPMEAGCTLVRHAQALWNTFSYHPSYYTFDKDVLNYFDLGPQNSRGFRALKVWLALRQAGRSGYVQMIGDDIRLAQALYRKLAGHADLERLTQGLSITTFRYFPAELKARSDSNRVESI